MLLLSAVPCELPHRSTAVNEEKHLPGSRRWGVKRISDNKAASHAPGTTRRTVVEHDEGSGGGDSAAVKASTKLLLLGTYQQIHRTLACAEVLGSSPVHSALVEMLHGPHHHHYSCATAKAHSQPSPVVYIFSFNITMSKTLLICIVSFFLFLVRPESKLKPELLPHHIIEGLKKKKWTWAQKNAAAQQLQTQ
ncbi:uncharacterized protein LOC133493348 [Syngnathoides biaculeatus]|uniref:uncharacterized protein LOC133493348 n=1 Tax=Syngnathoides biaculeatus TaxID=300417 RepID=UPI002ADDDB08|nr:uncharacterized protein LOC133493348 [Syngnathoides biaculeatus]